MIFEPMNFINNLIYMGVGMIGVFMIVGIIMGGTYLIGHLTSKMGQNNNE
jgi:hypothetical protein